MKRSVAQAAENEVTFRNVNERLKEKADELDGDKERTPFLCECEDERCTDVLLLQPGEYEEVRGHPSRFVVAPGHQGGDDQLVREGADFTVIEKHGEEGDLVARQDPRSNQS